jgi:hypothetical protein
MDGGIQMKQWIEETFDGITSVYEIYHQYCYLGLPIITIQMYIHFLEHACGYEVISKRKQVKGIKYTKYIIVNP